MNSMESLPKNENEKSIENQEKEPEKIISWNDKVTVEVAEDAMSYLVDVGYDPRLGARPMRRMVQSTVENIVAREMIARPDLSGSTITITLDDVKNIVEKQKEADYKS